MKIALIVAAGLAAFTGVAHSVLGERFILIRLFRREDLPKLFGSDWFTKRTLRFAWHVTSIAWWGFAAILLLLARPDSTAEPAVLKTIAITFLATATVTALASKGRHLAWPVFAAIGTLAWISA